MKPAIKGLIVVALVAALSFFASEETKNILPAPARLLGTYTTTSTRSTNVNKYCAANLNRSSLVSATDFSDAQSMRTDVNTQLKIDGYFHHNLETASFPA